MTRRKINLINWNKICQPLPNGGLGVKHMPSINEVLVMKLAWGLITNKDSLWPQVLKDKYGAGKELLLAVKLKNNSFPI